MAPFRGVLTEAALPPMQILVTSIVGQMMTIHSLLKTASLDERIYNFLFGFKGWTRIIKPACCSWRGIVGGW